MTLIWNRPGLLLTLTSAFWAGNFVIGRAIVGHVPPVTLACLRWVLAALILLPFAWQHLKQDAALISKGWRMLVFLGFIGAGCYNTFSYLGLVSTEALNGLVLGASGPMFIALAAWILFGDRLETAQLIGMITSFAGVLLIIAKGDLSSLAAFKFNPGDILIIVGMMTWSVYTAFLRKRPPISWQSFNVTIYAVAAVSNFPFALVEHRLGYSMHADLGTVATIGYAAVFPSLIGYIFYNRGVELVGPARAGLHLFLVPVFGAIFAMLFLNEKLYPFHAVGFVLIIAGVLAGTWKSAGMSVAVRRPGGWEDRAREP